MTDVTDTIEKFWGKVLQESDECAELPTDYLSAAEAVYIFSVLSFFFKTSCNWPSIYKAISPSLERSCNPVTPLQYMVTMDRVFGRKC